MKTTVKVALAALALSAFAFDGCKKGDGDPAISLLTRKMRVTGDWTLSKGEGSKTVGSVTQTVTYDGTTETDVTGSFTATDKYTETMSIEKDGTFTIVYTDNNGSSADVTTTKGTWNWTGGVGDAKKKAQLVLTVTSSANASGTDTYTGSDCPVIIYDLYELKNKEMIIIDKGTSAGSNTDTKEIKWTLTQ